MTDCSKLTTKSTASTRLWTLFSFSFLFSVVLLNLEDYEFNLDGQREFALL